MSEFTEAEIASMEVDDGTPQLLPQHVRRAIAGQMRDMNAAAARWQRNLAILKHESETFDHDQDGACCRAAVKGDA